MPITKSRRKIIIALVIVFLINIFIILFTQSTFAAVYKQGSSGETVKKIQQVLKSNGFYTASVDGIYGSKTTAAVKSFQKSCGITADGICGPITLKYLGISDSSSSGSSTTSSSHSSDSTLLARIIAAEARGEPYNGQVAVGAVIMNRIKHPSFPNSLSGVVYQPGAFSAIADGQFASTNVPDSCKRAAADALNGWDPSGGCIYYFNPATATSKWIWSRPQVMTIGKHIFCK
jgi:N-acetylmuramoyl-L-alanine amidase